MMPWIDGVGWNTPLEPANMRHRYICPDHGRFVPLGWWESRNKITFNGKPEQKQIERPVFGRKGA